MQIRLLKVFSLAVVAILASCSNADESDGVSRRLEKTPARDSKMLRANRYLNMRDQLVIKGYIERQQLKMKSSGLGYYYMKSAKGNGAPIKSGSVVLYSYKVKLIDGTPLDSSSKDLAQITIDKSEAISGLHDGLKNAVEGDSLQFIFPPYLAYGLLGDGDKIPARATLVYSIKVKSVK